jgi:hypothetical protein
MFAMKQKDVTIPITVYILTPIWNNMEQSLRNPGLWQLNLLRFKVEPLQIIVQTVLDEIPSSFG